MASASFDKAALDALHGSDVSGTFTDASISWTTGGIVAANQPLAMRIVKEGGTGTVLGFDNVRFTSVPSNTYSSWIDGFGLDPADEDFIDDPDGDGLANGLEAWFPAPTQGRVRGQSPQSHKSLSLDRVSAPPNIPLAC